MREGFRNIIFLVVGLLVFSGCSKEDEELSSTSVYLDQVSFFANAEFGDMPIYLSAGVDNVDLSTFYVVEESIVDMHSKLDKDELGNALQLVFRERYAPESSSFNEGLIKEIDYPLATPDQWVGIPHTYDVNFLLTNISDYNDVEIKFNGDASSGSGLSLTNQQASDDYFVISVDLGDSASECVKNITLISHFAVDENVNMDFSQNSTGVWEAFVFSEEKPISQVRWSVNDNFVGSGLSVAINPSVSTQTENSVMAEITFEDETEVTYIKSVILDNYNADCNVDLAWSAQLSEENRPDNIETIIVNYTDPFGKLYTSYNNHTSGWISLSGVSDYEVDGSNQQASRFSFEGEALLFSEDGEAVLLTNAFGNLAVAHP